MKLKKGFSLALALCLVLLTGCGGSPASSEKSKNLSIGTGSVSGVYYPLGGAIANLVSDHIPGYGCAAESTGGAVENATLIINGELDLGFVAASTLHDAQNSLNSFEGMDGGRCLAAFSFFPEVVQILSTDENIRSIPDLAGKRVAVGQSGSGTETMARTILELYNMSYDDISADFLGFGDAASGLKDGTVDAAFTWAGIPTASVMELGATHSISMVSFTDEELDRLMQISSYCVPAQITKDHYPSLYQEAQTFSIPAIICCSSDMPDDFVYDLLVTVFDNLVLLAQTHERGGDLSLESALDGLAGMKLHPGAEKFFREKGLL